MHSFKSYASGWTSFVLDCSASNDFKPILVVQEFVGDFFVDPIMNRYLQGAYAYLCS